MSEPTRYRVADNQAQLTLGGGVLVVDPAGPLVEYADYGRLKAEVETVTQEYRDATNHYNKLHNDLQAEVERLRKMSIDPAQVKKLVDDGVQDRPYHYTVKYTVEVSRDAYLRLLDAMTAYWNAAKEGNS